MLKLDPLFSIKAAFVLPIIEAFLGSEHGRAWTATRLGREAVKDPGKVFLLRSGMQLRPDTAHKILSTIDAEVPGFSTKFVEGINGVSIKATTKTVDPRKRWAKAATKKQKGKKK